MIVFNQWEPKVHCIAFNQWNDPESKFLLRQTVMKLNKLQSYIKYIDCRACKIL